MKATSLSDRLDTLAMQLNMIPPTDATADTITEVDAFYKGCAVNILAEVKQCEKMLASITDPGTQRRTAAALTGVRSVLTDVAALTPRSRETGFSLHPLASWYREFMRAEKRFHDPSPADFAAVTTAEAPARLTKRALAYGHYCRAVAVDGFERHSPADVWDATHRAGEKMEWTRAAFIRAVNRQMADEHGPRRERKSKARSAVRADQIEPRKRRD